MKWKQSINRALKKGKFTKLEKEKSGKYHTCCLGECFGLKTDSMDPILNKYVKSERVI